VWRIPTRLATGVVGPPSKARSCVSVAPVSAQRLQALVDTPGSVEAALELFDQLEAVEPDEMVGEWDGGLVPTGHPGEGQLDGLRWAGKAFRGPDDVDPMVCLDDGGERRPSDVMGGATLRRVEFRGVSTATMVYDSHPVFDHFRRVDDATVLGLMDRKGEDHPLVFFLRRRG